MTRAQRTLLGAFLAVAAAVALWQLRPAADPRGEAPQGPSDDATIARLFAERRSDEMVEVEGVVERTLSDDRRGSPHQRFILRLANGMTLLVAHNIALAPRVDLAPGDRVRVRGEYAWNPEGGVVHWTHADPDGDHPPGWVRVLP
ncbi:MAG: DUF3465 domain-containing protein [Thermoanaerobaculia bacterium]